MFRQDTPADLGIPINVWRVHLKLVRAPYLRPFLFAAVTCAVLTTTGLGKDASAGFHYLKADRPNAAELLTPPPLAGSAEQAADMAEVVSVSRACTSNEASQAVAEKDFSLSNFSAAIGP